MKKRGILIMPYPNVKAGGIYLMFANPGTRNLIAPGGSMMVSVSGLPYVIDDLAAVSKLFERAPCVMESEVTELDADLTREEVLKGIQKDFQKSVNCYFVFYFGHGEPGTGNWRLANDEVVSFNDILQLWNNRPHQKESDILFIYTDCCHSGHWVKNAFEKQLKNVMVQASVIPNNEAKDGGFTIPVWIQYLEGKLPIGQDNWHNLTCVGYDGSNVVPLVSFKNRLAAAPRSFQLLFQKCDAKMETSWTNEIKKEVDAWRPNVAPMPMSGFGAKLRSGNDLWLQSFVRNFTKDCKDDKKKDERDDSVSLNSFADEACDETHPASAAGIRLRQ